MTTTSWTAGTVGLLATLLAGLVVSQEPASTDSHTAAAPSADAAVDAKVGEGLAAGDKGHSALDGIELETNTPAESTAPSVDVSPSRFPSVPPPIAVPAPIAAARVVFEQRIQAAATPRQVEKVRYEIAQEFTTLQVDERVSEADRAASIEVLRQVGETAFRRESSFTESVPSNDQPASEAPPAGIGLAASSPTYTWLNDYVEPSSAIVGGPRAEEITPIEPERRQWARQMLGAESETNAVVETFVATDDAAEATRVAADRVFAADEARSSDSAGKSAGTDFFTSNQQQDSQAVAATPYFRNEPYVDGSVVDARGVGLNSSSGPAEAVEQMVASPSRPFMVAPPPPSNAAPGGAADDADLGGIRMGFSRSALRAARGGSKLAESMEELLIAAETDEELRQSSERAHGEVARYLASQFERREFGDVVSFSLRSWCDEVEAHRRRKAELPERLLHPGSLRRIVGYVVDDEEIRLLGTTQGIGRPLQIDDLVVGLQVIWRDGDVPACSLDPDPTDFGGPQAVRVLGVPADSHFALVMLQADYEMKKVLFGLRSVDVAGFTNIKQRIAALYDSDKESKSTDRGMLARFWFTPVPPLAGDLQSTPDGRATVFDARMRLETEAMELQGSSLGGVGRAHPLLYEASESFSAGIDDMRRQVPEFAELQTLFDVALLASALRAADIRHPLLRRITSWSHVPVEIPSGYPGLTTLLDVEGVTVSAIQGGVHARPMVTRETIALRYDEALQRWTEAADGTSGALTVLERRTPTTGGRVAPPEVRRLTMTGRFREAVQAATYRIDARPDDAETYILRAEAYATAGLYRLAERDLRLAALAGADGGRLRILHAKYAWERSGDVDPPTSPSPSERERLADAYFSGAAMQAVAGNAAEAMKSLERAERLTTRQVYAAAWRIRLLVALGRLDDADRTAAAASEQFPDEASLWLMRAHLAVDGDAAKQAQALLWAKRAIALEPLSVEALLLRAKLQLAVDPLEFAAAEDDVEKARKLAPNHPEIYVMQSRLAVLQGDIDGGLAACNQAVRVSPAYTPAYMQRYYIRLLTGDSPATFSANLQDCNTVLVLKPDDWRARVARAEMLVKFDQERLQEWARNPKRMAASVGAILIEHGEKLTILPTIGEPSGEFDAEAIERFYERFRQGMAEAAAVDFEVAADDANSKELAESFREQSRKIRARLTRT